MRVKVQAWGNSLGLCIPKAYATELGVQAGTEMEVTSTQEPCGQNPPQKCSSMRY